MLAYALLFFAQGSWIEDQPTSWPESPPVDVSAANILYTVSSLRDPAPAANDVIPRWENAYNELVGTTSAGFIRPGSAGRPDAPYEMWTKQAFIDHLIRLHGKGGLPFNPRGKFYLTAGYTWGVGSQGWNDHRDMVYQVHQFYHYQGALFGQPWGNIAWWMPYRHGYSTPRPTGTATTFDYWDTNLDWKLRFLWWRWFQQTGICHPFCQPGGAWESRCGQNCLPFTAAGPIKIREVLGAGVPTDVALRSMAESFALFETERARGYKYTRGVR